MHTILTAEEKYALRLRKLYHESGYDFYRMNRFEEYDFYAGRKDFLPSASILTFTDIDGRLMALRPDVTLSIIKHAGPGKYCYYEKVYRPRNSTSFREIPQCGIECTGEYDVREIISLALKSLHECAEGKRCALDTADAGKIAGLMPHGRESEILRLLSAKNIHGLMEISAPQEIIRLAMIRAEYDVIDGYKGEIFTDYSAVTSISYYSGIVFRGYIDGIPETVLSGGEYTVDGVKGAGFAVYLDAVTGG